MTMEQYEAILAFQGGVCYICQRPPAAGKYLHVDHDHAVAKASCAHDHKLSCSNCWRGLVHRHCNDLLAIARDSTPLLLRAVDYLGDPPAQKVVNGDNSRAGQARSATASRLVRGGHEPPE